MEEIVGTVTCWPSLLSMAATFDLSVMRKFSLALGAEFAGKGANMILGPSINVHRIAKGGRTFGYLSVRAQACTTRPHSVLTNGSDADQRVRWFCT